MNLNDEKYPILRILYDHKISDDLFDEIEKALNRAKYNVKLFGGGDYITHRGEYIGNCDFSILNFKEFDYQFSLEIISNIISSNFDCFIIENDPIY